MCGSWDRNQGNDKTGQEWRASRTDSLFFYKATGGNKCLAEDACHPERKFKASGGWINLVFSGKWILFTLCNIIINHKLGNRK